MRKMGKALLAAGMVVAFSSLAVPNASAYERCSTGRYCIYSGFNGSGSICQVIPEHHDVTAQCLWTGTNNAKSVKNMTTSQVYFYGGTNFTQFRGSTASGGQGNLQGSYKIRSVGL
ncbi:peptidase inhibitor family I36 protein [Streptomyces sp. NPDC005963]|uniref:peptidase inhibitor family I36 protein n=1 Tax=Streptomyces sp. NPDC005963 TaxID=3156721 RepID=UPI003404B0D9